MNIYSYFKNLKIKWVYFHKPSKKYSSYFHRQKPPLAGKYDPPHSLPSPHRPRLAILRTHPQHNSRYDRFLSWNAWLPCPRSSSTRHAHICRSAQEPAPEDSRSCHGPGGDYWVLPFPSLYKVFTGRVGLPLVMNAVDTSHIWQFGILRERLIESIYQETARIYREYSPGTLVK